MSTGMSTGSLVAWMLSMAVLWATSFCRWALFLHQSRTTVSGRQLKTLLNTGIEGGGGERATQGADPLPQGGRAQHDFSLAWLEAA
jgi:hypothetical protein